jgi:hypothetical protein
MVEIDIIVAIIALISSGFTAIITIILTKQNDAKIRHLENELQTKREELNARREYEYELKNDFIKNMNHCYFNLMNWQMML